MTKSMRIPKILILGMGGTIAGIASHPELDPLNYEAGHISIQQLLGGIVQKDAYHLKTEQIANINSCDLTHELLTRLVNRVREALVDEDVDGIVITHGTDTMEETGIFLHLTCAALCRGSQKIIVLTGAMLPSNAPGADGPSNLALSIQVASKMSTQSNGILMQSGVIGVFAGRIIAAKDFAKRSSDQIDAPVKESPELTNSIMSRLLSEEDLSYPELGQSWPWVEIVTNHVDPKPDVLEFLKNQGVSGVILAGTGQGNIHQNLLPVIKEFSQRGIPVLRCSRTGLGVIRHNVSFNDDELGTLAAGSLTSAKARIALELLIYNRLIGKSLDFKKKLATM